jgi:hypothetical protein
LRGFQRAGKTGIIQAGLGLLLLFHAAGWANASLQLNDNEGVFQVSILSPPDNHLVTASGLPPVEGLVDLPGATGAGSYDFFFVLDISGSMAWNDPENYRNQGVRRLVESFPPELDIRIGLCVFQSTARLVHPLTSDRQSLVASLDTLVNGGGTNIAAGLNMALNELGTNGRSASQHFIVLFSDGDQTYGDARLVAESADMPIHCFFLGPEISNGADLMRDISAYTNGLFSVVSNAESLKDVFLRILNWINIAKVVLTSTGDAQWSTTTTITGKNWTYEGEIPLRSGIGQITEITASAYTTENPPRVAKSSVRVRMSTPCRSVTEVLPWLDEPIWEPNPLIQPLAPLLLTDTAEGLRLLASSEVPSWYFGFYQCRDFLCALPPGPHVLRLALQHHRQGTALLPDPRIRVFRADNSVSHMCRVNEVTGKTLPSVLEIPFVSDGESPFRIAADQMLLDARMRGGWSCTGMEIHSPHGYELKASISSVALASFVGECGGDLSGSSIAHVGDVNGDGWDDLLIGARMNSHAGENAGQVYLVFGPPHNWFLWNDLAYAPVSFLGERDYDNAGFSVACAGDVNGDGLMDFLIGAPGNDDAGAEAGKVYLILGRREGWQRRMPLADVADATFLGEAPGDSAGRSLAAAGDVNGDGYDDFLVGAPFNDFNAPEAGQVYLILGRPDGWAIGTSLSAANASFLGEQEQDRAGLSIAGAGDVNRDGFSDLLIGAPGNPAQTGAETGKSYLLFGKHSSWGLRFPLSAANASFPGEARGDFSGATVAAVGDVNGDGFDDFMIGSIRNSQTAFQAGKVYLFLGRSTGWSRNMPIQQADASFLGEAHYDYAGFQIAGGGDVNGDGLADIVVSAIGCDVPQQDSGRVYLIPGKLGGWAANVPLRTVATQFFGQKRSDFSGYGLLLSGDYDGDGFADVVISAVKNPDGGTDAGQTYVLFGGRNQPRFASKTGCADAALLHSPAQMNFILNDLNETSWETRTQVNPYDAVRLLDVPEGLSFTIVAPPYTGNYGYYQTRASMPPLPAGVHVLRVHLVPIRLLNHLLPDIRVRVFHADNSISFSTLMTEAAGRPHSPALDVPFLSNGVSDFRIAIDLIAFDKRMNSGWIVSGLEMDPLP